MERINQRKKDKKLITNLIRFLNKMCPISQAVTQTKLRQFYFLEFLTALVPMSFPGSRLLIQISVYNYLCKVISDTLYFYYYSNCFAIMIDRTL